MIFASLSEKQFLVLVGVGAEKVLVHQSVGAKGAEHCGLRGARRLGSSGTRGIEANHLGRVLPPTPVISKEITPLLPSVIHYEAGPVTSKAPTWVQRQRDEFSRGHVSRSPEFQDSLTNTRHD